MIANASDRFYADLTAFSDFAEFSDLSAYSKLPDDWALLASDVVGSTQAIDDGRYKEVNMAGAATIMAVLNAIGEVDAPYVFGGDGALIAVPQRVLAAAGDALARAAGLTERAYGLELRVAAFPIGDIRARGADISVRKFALGHGARLAMFAGDGVALVDRLIRDDVLGAPYRIAKNPAPPDLEGLSCRWEPLAPTHGVMVTLMASSLVTDEEQELKRIRTLIQEALGGDETIAAPVSDGSLKFRWPPRALRLEALAQMGRRSFWSAYIPLLLQSLAQGWAERFGRRAGPYDAPKYRQEMIAQTDFRKFDGLLRMVLDVSTAQADALEAALQAERAAGRIAYGMHRADSALMTCLVFDFSSADHVHFIDGADGGFAVASRQFKAQLQGEG